MGTSLVSPNRLYLCVILYRIYCIGYGYALTHGDFLISHWESISSTNLVFFLINVARKFYSYAPSH